MYITININFYRIGGIVSGVYSKLSQMDRSSHRRCSIEKAVLKNFAIFTGNTCVGVSLIKL